MKNNPIKQQFMMGMIYAAYGKTLLKLSHMRSFFIKLKQTDVPLRHRLVKLEKRSNMRDGPSLLSIIPKISNHEKEADLS